jgi:hypothetical protein
MISMTAPLPDVVLYARAGCHLCDEAREILHALLAERAVQGRPVSGLLERDIDSDPELHRAFFATIPVVEVGDRRLELATSPAKLRRLLDEGLMPEAQAVRPGDTRDARADGGPDGDLDSTLTDAVARPVSR